MFGCVPHSHLLTWVRGTRCARRPRLKTHRTHLANHRCNRGMGVLNRRTRCPQRCCRALCFKLVLNSIFHSETYISVVILMHANTTGWRSNAGLFLNKSLSFLNLHRGTPIRVIRQLSFYTAMTAYKRVRQKYY